MEKTIEIQLAELRARISQAILGGNCFIQLLSTSDEFHFRPDQEIKEHYAKIARTTK